MQLRGCFLELLAIAAPAKISPAAPGEFGFGAYNRDFLRRREGMSMLVFQSEDARRDQAEFAAAGLHTYPPFHFGRDARLPDGTTARVAFTLAFVTDPRLPEAAFFACQQHAPHYFWKADYQTHANGARTIAEVFMVAPDPPALAGLFAGLQGREAVRQEGRNLAIATARGCISVLTPAAFLDRFGGGDIALAAETPHFAGYRVAGVDQSLVRGKLEAAGIAYRPSSDAIQIPATAAFGVAIELAA